MDNWITIKMSTKLNSTDHPHSHSIYRLNGTFSQYGNMLPIGMPMAPFGNQEISAIVLSILVGIILICLIIGLIILHKNLNLRHVAYSRFPIESAEQKNTSIKTISIPEDGTLLNDNNIICEDQHVDDTTYYCDVTQGGNGASSFVGMNRPILAENSRL